MLIHAISLISLFCTIPQIEESSSVSAKEVTLAPLPEPFAEQNIRPLSMEELIKAVSDALQAFEASKVVSTPVEEHSENVAESLPSTSSDFSADASPTFEASTAVSTPVEEHSENVAESSSPCTSSALSNELLETVSEVLKETEEQAVEAAKVSFETPEQLPLVSEEPLSELVQMPPDYCYFIPPKGWDIADPDALSPRVQIAFIGKSKKEFLPTINLAREDVNVSLPEYVAAVKKIHEADPNNRWRDLGTYQTAQGEGRLTELEAKTEWGVARLMQLIFLKNNKAYIITASALKEEFPKYYADFEAAFHSLTVTTDLLSSIVSKEKRELLEEAYAKLKSAFTAKKTTSENLFTDKAFMNEHWQPLQDTVIQNFSDMGAHWQVLMLQMAKNELVKMEE